MKIKLLCGLRSSEKEQCRSCCRPKKRLRYTRSFTHRDNPPLLVRQSTQSIHFNPLLERFKGFLAAKREGKEKGLPIQTKLRYSVSNIMATKKQGATTKKTAAKKTALKKTAAKKTTAKKTAAKKAPAKKTAAKKTASKKSASKATKKASTKRG
jgi:hypothetical protein